MTYLRDIKQTLKFHQELMLKTRDNYARERFVIIEKALKEFLNKEEKGEMKKSKYNYRNIAAEIIFNHYKVAFEKTKQGYEITCNPNKIWVVVDALTDVGLCYYAKRTLNSVNCTKFKLV
jgi:hypothetical protein